MDIIPTIWTPSLQRKICENVVEDLNNNNASIISAGTDEYNCLHGTQLFEGYSPVLLSWASFTCIAFMFIGVPGNLITVIALTHCKKVRNATAVFIINLSLSDLLFCCFNLPLAASTFFSRSWNHSDLLCRLFPLIRYGLLAVSLFTILSITINRYVMIEHPRLYSRIYRHRYIGLMIASTWIGAFCSLIPTWKGNWGRFGLDTSIGSCSILPDIDGNSPKAFLFVMAFVVPCCCIFICYARIFYKVRRTTCRTQDVNGSSTANVKSKQIGGVKPITTFPPHPPVTVATSSQSEPESIGQQSNVRPFLSKLKEDDLKFIDTSVESDSTNPIYMSAPYDIVYGINRASDLTEQTTNCVLLESAMTDEYGSINNCDCEYDNQRQHKLRKSLKSSISRITKRQFRSISAVNTSGASALYSGRMSHKDKRLLKMILVIFISFIVCYLPITVTKIYKEATECHVFNIMGYLLIYLTTCINPIIYVVMSSEYRQAYKNLVMCK